MFKLGQTLAIGLAVWLAMPIAAPAADEAPAEAELNEARSELRDAQDELRALTARIGELSTKLGLAEHRDQLVYLNKHRRAIIGIVIGTGKDSAGNEPIITGVTPGSAAEDAGVQTGDRIVEVNGVAIGNGKRGVEEAFDAIGKLEEGDEVTLVLERDGETIRETLAARRMAPKSWVFNFDGERVVPPLAPLAPGVDVAVLPERLKHVEKQMEALRLSRGQWPMGGMGSLRVIDLDANLARYFDTEGGALILNVEPDSGFNELAAGDVAKSIDGEAVNGEKDFWKVIRKRTGEPTEVEVIREGRPMTVEVVPPDHMAHGFAYAFSTRDCEDDE